VLQISEVVFKSFDEQMLQDKRQIVTLDLVFVPNNRVFVLISKLLTLICLLLSRAGLQNFFVLKLPEVVARHKGREYRLDIHRGRIDYIFYFYFVAAMTLYIYYPFATK